jgi:hypothetical protein
MKVGVRKLLSETENNQPNVVMLIRRSKKWAFENCFPLDTGLIPTTKCLTPFSANDDRTSNIEAAFLQRIDRIDVIKVTTTDDLNHL